MKFNENKNRLANLPLYMLPHKDAFNSSGTIAQGAKDLQTKEINLSFEDNDYHIPVLFNETLDALGIKEDGVYVDGTAGGGGHSLGIGQRLKTGTLFSIDQDPQAVETVRNRLKNLSCRVIVEHTNFVNIEDVLAKHNIGKVDGVLLDIGVSSHQLDSAERGFSFHEDAPLDMRMSLSGLSAADLVNTLPERELAEIFFKYGEEKYSRRIAQNIVNYRMAKGKIETTLQLVEIIKESVPAAYKRAGHPARKVFQALRIEVNKELEVLTQTLEKAFECLNPSGRLAVITFHSLEDRIVKQKFVELSTGCVCPPEIPICVCGEKPKGKTVFKKPVTAGEKELEYNVRSRSAKLRCIEKIPL